MSSPLRRISLVSIFILLGFGLVWALPVISRTTPDQLIFGPKQYLRTTGSSNQNTDTFTVPTSVGAPFLLHIANGDAKGSHRILSGTITLNGVVVVRSQDFSRRHHEEEGGDDDDDDPEDAVAVIDKTLTLKPKNTLQVKLKGKPGSFLTLSVFGVTIGAANQVPTAKPDGPFTGTVGQPIQFDGTRSSDPEKDPLTFSWNFGDGDTGTGPTPMHTYTAPGNYTVSLTVDDGHGHTNTATTVARILSPLTQARVDHTATLLPSGQVLLAGGTGPTGVVNTAELFDPVTLSATALTSSLTTARTEHTATLLPQTETLLIAGQDSLGLLFSTELFNPANQTFRALSPNVQGLRSGHTATLLLDGRLLITGGQSSGALGSAEAFNAQTGVVFKPAYDPEAGAFTVLPNSLVTPRWDHTATVLADGRILLTGGRNETGVLASAEIFDPATETFGSLASTLTTPRAGHTATLLPDGRVLILGGQTAAGAVASAEVFSASTNSFSAVTPGLTTPRVNHTATLVPTGFVLIAGGQNSGGILASTELYTPILADTLAPVVNQVTPPSGATGVDVTEIIGVRFSEPVDVRTLTSGSVTLSNGGSVTATTSPGEQGLMLFVVPSKPLAAGTTYTLSLTSGIKDTSGHPLSAFTSQLTTVAAPTITSFAPGNGQPGTAVTITGTNFDPVASKNEVKFNGVPATATSASATSLTAIVSSGATTGPITVTTRGGTATSATNFTVIIIPVINGFTPTTGPIGTAVTIFGTNFDASVPSNNTVRFNGTQANVSTVTATSITTTVPQSATTGPITVTTPQGTATSPTPFTVLPPPSITGFTPSQGKPGTNVTITGQNFDPVAANNQVRFNGVPAGATSATSTTLIVSVPPTATTGFVTVTTAGSTAQSATAFTVISITAFSVTPALVTLPIGESQQVRAIATFADQTTLDITSFTTWGTSNPNVASVTGGGLAQGATQGTATITGTVGSLMGSETVQVIAASGGPLPPDPAAVAPAVDRTVATTLGQATAFLYSGSNPIQTGVAPGTITITRAAVVRGMVHGRDGFPIPGVVITILNHPEFGRTLTRPDGMFDMAVNGGGQLTVNYAMNGLLSAQRQVDVPWQDYVTVPDVVMIALDPQVTAVTLTGATTIQVARGSAVTDADGTRQATLLFAPGTTATMTLPDGTTQPLTTLSVRATEYTVSADGPKAMPAELPPTSAYTYAVEYSVDEAMNAGSTIVQFSQPVISYVENFLNFSVGTPIPSGYYDRGRGTWVASTNGQVIKILTITAGLADVDTDGDGVADSGLGITSAERQRLASLYQPGQSLWRVPVDHFSSWDYNLGFGPPFDAIFSHLLKFIKFLFVNDQCEIPNGSVIGCENQTLGESVPLTGTPFQLHYQSDRVAGRRESFSLEIPVSGSTLPASLKRIDLEIAVAGRTFTQSFPSSPNQRTTFTWDGLDAYGRRLQGNQPIIVRLKYVYDAVYTRVERFASSTGNITTVPTRREVNLVETWQGTLGLYNAQAARLGGWTLNVHHAYDPFGRVLDLGNGERVKAEGLPAVLMTLAGNGSPGFSGDNGPATQAQLSYPAGIGPTPDGGFYLVDAGRIRRVSPDGIITTVAGTGVLGSSGDGGSATQAQIWPNGLAVGPDGAYYIVEYYHHRVRRVGTDGVITTVVGTGTQGFNGDGILATQAQINNPREIIVGPDNSLYLTDSGNNRVRRVGPDGIITTVAGTGAGSYGGDGGPATQAQLYNPSAIAVGPDGSLYVADVFNNRIRRVGPTGTITTVAGTGAGGNGGDGGPATAAQLNSPYGVTLGPDGSLYIADYYNQRVRRVGPDGIITTVAGNGDTGVSADGFPATQGPLSFPYAGAVAPDGNLYFSDYNTYRIRRLASPFPGFSAADTLVPSKDSSELYVFNGVGKHQQTLDALTGAVRYQLTYDSTGLLVSVTDGAGQVTTIERDGTGNVTAIVAPGGQRTTFSLEGNGYLASITNPAGETTQLTYSADGLLATLTDPRNGLHQYTYDTQGRLIKDQDPANGFKALARTDQSTGWTVALSTALNRTTSYQVENLAIGDLRRKVTDPSGLLTTTLIGQDGTTTVTGPDGTVTTTIEGPDPRFGMQAPILSSLSVRLPSSLTSTLTTTRTAALSNPTDPFSLTSQTNVLVINGRTYTSTFTQSAKTITTTTPAGRVSTVTLDAQGRVIQEQVTGLEAVSYTYDAQGRLSTITQGTGTTARTSALSYDTKNQLTSVQDPLLRTVGFAYDLAGRITTQTLPDLRTIGYAYDGNGNVTTITPPSRPAHGFSYTPVDLESTYDPPNAGFSPKNTQYSYNLDRQLTLVTRPDGQTLSLGYDTGGRLSTLTLPGNLVTTYAYDGTKGTLASIATPNSTLSYAYDGSLLTNTTWAGMVAGSVGRTYDNNFRISSQSVNGANTITFGYDTDSLLTSAGALTIGRSTQNGLITGSTLGVVTDSRTYSTFGELSSYTAGANSATVLDVQYTRDKLGRITQKVETVSGGTDTFAYTYDTAGRLTDVTKNGTLVSHYVYDSNGNRLSLTDSTSTVNGTYDAQDRLTQYGNLQFTYTANGELVTKTNPVLGQSASFSYDVLGNLRTASLPGGTTIEYVVDGQNRRIGKKLNGVLTQGFLYQNQLNPVAELDGTGNIVSRFVYGTKANVPDYMVKGGVTYRIVSDHLGSPRLVINTTDGSVAQRIDFDEFGNIILDTNPGFQPFGFAGGLYDQHTGLTRFGARDYDAQVGRWTAKDPIDFGGRDANLFGYTFSDPVNGADASGLSTAIFDPSLGTLTVVDSNGNIVAQVPAGNNTTLNSNGLIPPGIYPVSKPVSIDPKGDINNDGIPDGIQFGPYFFPIGGVEGRTGLGIHGVGKRAGPQSKTKGCIRTPNEDLKNLVILDESDPITTVIVGSK